jgi:predicted metalloprotease with PDZ domain
MSIRYRVHLHDPAAHLLRVEMTVPSPDPRGQLLRLPAWIPGSYMIREFARNIVSIVARDDRGPVALTRDGKDSFRAPACEGALVVTIEVYAWDLSVRAAHLDLTHGFFNGTSVFLCAEGFEAEPHEVELVLDGPTAHWEVATTLPRTSGDDWRPGTFLAKDYDQLIDHPFELGTFQRVRFDACGVPHDVVITGKATVDLHRLCRDLQPICEAQIRMFGEPAPFDRYLFFVMAVGDGYGGLEHRDSTALVCKRTDLPQHGVAETSEEYRTFLGLCSHEYFHSWNVKRIKPAAFVPYDLWREAHTTQLWAFEGVTSYFDDLVLVRSGVIEPRSYYELLARTVTGVLRQPGRFIEPLATASYDAWTKYYRQDENFPNAHTSYYTKGSLVGLCLDLLLRQRTDDRVTLDVLWKTLWARWGDGSGVPEGAIEAVAAELAGDLSAFFDNAVRGTGDLPLAELLATVGLRLNLRAATNDKDPGGKPAPREGIADPGDLGAKVGPGGKLVHVFHGGAAHLAGLSAGDVVIALDGLKVDENLTRRVRGLPVGTVVTLHAFRRDELITTTATLQAPPATTVWIDEDPAAIEAAIARRQAWLAR